MHSDFLNQKYQEAFKAALVKGAKLVGKYELPLLSLSTFIPKRAIPFDKAATASDRKQWVHFYTDDYRYERIWNFPQRYLLMLSSFEGVITPDFSVYTDLPLAMQIWNTYRNRALAYWLQHCHIPIVPNVQWGDLPSYEFCFDGIAKGSTVAVSTNGCIKSIYDKHIFQCGFERMMNVISPQAVIVYSNMPESIFGKYIAQGVPIVNIENYHATVRKKAVHNG